MSAIERAIRAHKIALLFEAAEILDEMGYGPVGYMVHQIAREEKLHGGTEDH